MACADDLEPSILNPIWMTPPTGDGLATEGQFSAAPSLTSAVDQGELPVSGNLKLEQSSVGGVFSTATPDYFIGDIIAMPVSTFTDHLGRSVSFRRQPVAPGETFLYRSPGETTSETPFQGAASDRFFWSPHASFRVRPPIEDEVVESIGGDSDPLRDGFTYASEPGLIEISWRTEAPIGVSGANEPVYGLVTLNVRVSSGSRLPVRRIFWTEAGFKGPPVSLPAQVQQVRIAYGANFPELVAEGDEFPANGSTGTGPGSEIQLPRRTLWFDTVQKNLRSYNVEGRVLVEFLAETRVSATQVRRQIGVEVVDVIQEAAPVIVAVPLGERLYPMDPARPAPLYPLPAESSLREQRLRETEELLASLSPSEVLNLNPNSPGSQFIGPFEVDGRLAYFAQQATVNTADVQIYWRETGLAGIQWPKFLNNYDLHWPDDLNDYVLNIRPTDAGILGSTLPIFGQNTTVQFIYQDDPANRQATPDTTNGFHVSLTGADPVNRSLILVRNHEDFWFIRVESVLDSALTGDRYGDYYQDKDGDLPLTAIVGERLSPPPGASSIAGYVDLSQGDAIDMSAYIDPFSAGIAAAESGAIIPVNASPEKAGRPNDRLGVWWFKRIDPPARAFGKLNPVYWPSYYQRYNLVWPDAAPAIVLASGDGSGDLAPDAAQGSIYTQNDPSRPGYNPNEEHAQMIAGRAYALRNDLNTSQTTSSPFALVRYTDAADRRPAMKVFQVLREDDTHTFQYTARAGAPLPLPMPLAVMAPPLKENGTSRNTETPGIPDLPSGTPSPGGPDYAEYESFLFEDRNGMKWVYRGAHDPLDPAAPVPTLGVQLYYKTLEGFAYPDPETGRDEAPQIGTITPFLRPGNASDGFTGDPVSGESIALTYTPYWPDLIPDNPEEIPILQFAETLVKAKFGLPSLHGASSARVLYQQSIARDISAPRASAVLHDPTRRKTFPFFADHLPASIPTSASSGRIYFQDLPPHLQERFYLDASSNELVLEGEFREEIVGEDFLLPNVLGQSDLQAIIDLVPADDPLQGSWSSLAIGLLSTVLETFVESDSEPGSYIPDPGSARRFFSDQIVEITNDDQAVDSYALTAIGGGSGYLTLVLGNGEAFTDPSEPVQLVILKVGAPLYTGQVKPITPLNPLSEQITLQHTGDFAGNPDQFEFEWYYSPPVDGQPPANRPGENGATWFPLDETAEPRVTFSGDQPLITLSDNWVVMRYRPREGHVLRPAGSDWDSGDGWSQWTAPALAEGWIKRVLAGINPFNQRVSDFYNNAVNTDVSLLTQAGTRWEGDIPLTLDAVQDASLIEIYETLIQRAIRFTIDNSIDYGPANDALLLAAGYLNDLYMALGNEAFADASNPLIALDVDPSRLLVAQGLPSSIGTTIQNTATARFAFSGQVSSLLDEELALLRGRDDTLVPGVRTAPVYNRLYWNFTRGIDAGEVIYALNYNITEKPGADADGKIDAADASRQYPQAHGDAYGHYLTALKNYYRLLSNPNFTWTPRVEAVNILGAPVTVDYQDERKFAAAAIGLGRAAARIIDLERRKLPSGSHRGWTSLREEKSNAATGVARTWGVEQWAVRSGQGNYLHWVVANAFLPEDDGTREGVQKIDRQTVPELRELAAIGRSIQKQMDAVNRRANALDLPEDGLLFDLSPGELADGQSHFDQVFARAKTALLNLKTAHARTVETNNLLRSIENQAADYSFTVAQEEYALVNKLYEIYGMPYPGDVGPGKTYPQGYSDPDFFRFMYINRPYVYNRSQLFGDAADGTRLFHLPIRDSSYADRLTTFDRSGEMAGEYVEDFADHGHFVYEMDLNNGPYIIAPPSLGQRPYIGNIQNDLARVMAAKEDFYRKMNSLNIAQASFARKLDALSEDTQALNQIAAGEEILATLRLTREQAEKTFDLMKTALDNTKESYNDILNAVNAAFPTVVGTSNDITAPARSALLASKLATNTTLSASEMIGKTTFFAIDLGLAVSSVAHDSSARLLNKEISARETGAALRSSYGELFSAIIDIDAARIELEKALEAYNNTLVDGETLLTERETFRKRAASVIQGSRIRDVAFRAFRTEALEQYKILFDQAARYTWLAAKAYDYETGLLGSPAGREFFAQIAATRSLGLVGPNGEPQFAGSETGDPGLSGLLAKLEQDWSVAKGRLGINNPDAYSTAFSLRRELFNLPYNGGDAESHTAWQDRLRASYVSDLRTDSDFAAHALPPSNPSGLPIPGFVIPFGSTIESGVNFFGKPLAAGDSTFSSASFSTKIHSVGIAFLGYKGMNPGMAFNPSFPFPQPPSSHSDPNALSATPYVYLLPVGSDLMRTPPVNGAESDIRNWLVHEHAMPLPFDIGGGPGSGRTWTGATSLTEPFFLPRKHQPFRALDDTWYFYSNLPREYTNSRLIGRSVWNTGWKLIVPAEGLLADPSEGAERFINSVRDIKLFIRSYSYSGN